MYIQLLDVDPDEEEEEGANVDLDSRRKGKCAVIKTSTRQVKMNNCIDCELCLSLFSAIAYGANVFFLYQTVFLPLIGLVDPETLKPGDIIGVNKDSFLILDTLPAE